MFQIKHTVNNQQSRTFSQFFVLQRREWGEELVQELVGLVAMAQGDILLELGQVSAMGLEELDLVAMVQEVLQLDQRGLHLVGLVESDLVGTDLEGLVDMGLVDMDLVAKHSGLENLLNQVMAHCWEDLAMVQVS